MEWEDLDWPVDAHVCEDILEELQRILPRDEQRPTSGGVTLSGILRPRFALNPVDTRVETPIPLNITANTENRGVHAASRWLRTLQFGDHLVGNGRSNLWQFEVSLQLMHVLGIEHPRNWIKAAGGKLTLVYWMLVAFSTEPERMLPTIIRSRNRTKRDAVPTPLKLYFRGLIQTAAPVDANFVWALVPAALWVCPTTSGSVTEQTGRTVFVLDVGVEE